MKNVFIIEEIKFIYKVLEQTFTQAQIDTYIHTSSSEFSYFIDDLKPDLLLVSLDLISSDIDGFKAELSKSKHKVRVIIYGESSELEKLEGEFFGALSKPLEQSQLVSQITHLMTQN